MPCSRLRIVRKSFLLVAVVLLLPLSWAYSQKPPEPPAEAEEPVFREVSIYIPYNKLRETFEKEDRGVFLPYAKFQELWKAARENQRRDPQPHPPVGALITEIENEATIGESVVEVSAKLKIDLLTEGWHQIPLRLADAAVQSARIGGEAARLVFAKDGGQLLLVERTGKEPQQLVLELKYTKSFTKSPGRNSVQFQAPQAPVNRWRIRIPEAGVKVNVQPLLAATEVPEDAAEAETVVLAFVGASPNVSIDWTPKSEGAKGLKALATVQSEQQVVVDEGVVRTRTQLTYEISRAELTQLVIEVPANQKVAGIFDPNVRKWEVTKEEAGQRITVQLFEPARKQQSVTIELEEFHEEKAEQEIQVPVVRAVGVARQQGVVVARLGAGLRGEAVRRTGLLQMDVAEMPAALRSQPWAFSYRYASLPFDLALRVEKIEPRISVNELVEAYLEPERLTVDLFAIYTIERAGVFELSIDLPVGFEVRQVRGHEAAGAAAAVVDFHQVLSGETPVLKVNLARKALGRVGLFVELERRLTDLNLLSPTGKSSDILLPLPRAHADSVQRSTGRLMVYGPESLRLSPSEAEGMRSVSFSEALEGLASVRGSRFPQLRPVLAYAYTQGPAKLTVVAERRKPQITARQLLVARIDSGVVKFDATITYEILYSGVSSLRIDLPAEIAAEVHNNTGAIREKVIDPAPKDTPEGYIAWSLTGEAELLGQVAVHFTWQRPLDRLDVGASTKLEVPRLIPQDVARAWGQIVVTKGETIDVRPDGKPEGLRPIDAQHDLMAGASVSDAARAFEFHDDWKLNLTATRYQLEEVKRTSIERAVLRMVVTRSDQIAVQALYRMRSARQRLEVQLPDEVVSGKIQFDTEPLRINGRPVTLERGVDSKTFFVPLVGQTADAPFVLELRYTSPGSAAQLKFPYFPDDPAVQQVHMCVYLPHELANLGFKGPWTDEQDWRSNGPFDWHPVVESDHALVQQVVQGIGIQGDPASTFATDGTLYVYSTLRPTTPDQDALRLRTLSHNWLSGLVMGAIAVLGLVLLRRGASERLAAFGALVVSLVLMGVFLPTLSVQIMSGPLLASLVVVLMIWFAVFAIRDLPALRGVWTKNLVAATGQLSPEPVRSSSESPPPTVEPSQSSSSEDETATEIVAEDESHKDDQGGESHA